MGSFSLVFNCDDGPQVWDRLTFRPDSGGTLFEPERQGYLALRVEARWDSVHVVVLGGEGRKDSGEGVLRKGGASGVGLFPFGDRRFLAMSD